MEAQLQFTVTNQEIEKTDNFTVVEGSDQYLYAQFTFTTDDWDGLYKTGVFIDEDGTTHPSLCTDDICAVPAEWLKKQKGAVGVLGSDGTVRITTKTATVRIQSKGYEGDAVDEGEAASYFDQIMAAFAEGVKSVAGYEVSAEAWAHGHGDYPERDGDNAMYYANQAKETAQAITESKENLDLAISDGRQIVKDAKTETGLLNTAISDSRAERVLVSTSVEEAGEANTTLTGTIERAGESKTQAEETKQQLDDTTASAQELKTALESVTEEVAKDATVEDVAELLQKSLEFLAAIAETAGQAESLNGFGLNLGADGAVILAYTDPDTGVLSSATFPRESTLQDISDALTGINENLKIIAIREGETDA